MSEEFLKLMGYYAQKREDNRLPEFEHLLYESMCRVQTGMNFMQEAMFKKELRKLNAELDSDPIPGTQSGS